MPRHADVVVPPRAATILTDSADASITTVRLQNVGDHPVRVQATATAVAPANFEGAIQLRAGEIRSETLAALFPGVATPLHLWAWSDNGSIVSASHA